MTGRTLTARPSARSAASDAPAEVEIDQINAGGDAVIPAAANGNVAPLHADAGSLGAKATPTKATSAKATSAKATSAKATSATAVSATATPVDAASAKAPSPNGKGQNLQDQFLNLLRKNKTPVTMFLVKGVKLQGIVTWFDNFSILLRRDGHSQMVYKHAISTIMPSQPVDARQFLHAGDAKKLRVLQDVFLTSVRNAAVQVTMFLVNGVMLQGRIAAYDLFCLLLERDGYVQMAYKHAVSTIQPLAPVDLSGDWDGEEDTGA